MDLDSQICRLCLERVDPSSVAVLNNDPMLIESILQITTIEVIVDPTRLVFMCDLCHTMLNQSVQFRMACLQNDDTFRKMYAKLTLSSEFVKVEPDDPEEALVEFKLEDESQSSEQENNILYKDLEPEIDILEQEQESGPTKQEKPLKSRKKKTKKEQDNDSNEPERPHMSRKKNKNTEQEQAFMEQEDPQQPCKEVSKKDNKVQCQTCGAFVTQRRLSKHILTHVENRPMFPCDLCEKKYTELRRLREHIKFFHERKVEHPCKECGKIFYRASTLKEHFRAEHTDIKPFECKICGERFARAPNRAYHYTMNHSTAHPFKCEFCLKTFKRSNDHRVHVRTHTGEKPYKCDLCDKRFCKSYNVVIHMKSHRNAEMKQNDKMAVMEGASEGFWG